MKALCLALLMALASAVGAQETYTLASPDGRVTAQLLKDGNYWHLHALAGKQLMADATLGLTVSGYRFMTGLTCDSVAAPAYLEERYTAVHGKRSQVSNEANTQRFFFTNSTKKTLQLEVRAYNDGVTFRYHIGATDATSREFSSEATAYTIPDEAQRWLQSFSTSYEGDYPLQQGAEQQGAWGYPALFQCAGSYALITEAISDATYCATHLDNTAKANTYKVAYPYAWEGNNTGDANPKSTMPWTSPWRVIIMGDLATVMQSTLVEDVSPATTMDDVSWIEPASAAWIYWAYNHGTKDYQLCKEYVDLATTMGWKYVLFDWEWDQMSNGGNLEDVCRYATDNGIKPLLWYNSGGPHNQVGSTPRDRMLTHESRCKEFEWLKSIGIVGVKIDFFESDKQNMMQYYLDILRDAADYHMLVNFHGCTAPRGWSRTWPHLMSMEAVHGAEQYNNGGNMTNIAPRLNCTLPFTRNVVGPMDYTPVAFTNSQYPHLTTSAHELALSVVFESGIQHWADRPSGFYDLPALAKQHMSEVPTAWDETLLLQGHPGTDVVVARRKGSLWYVGGLNGEDYRKNYTIDFSFLPADKDYVATLLADGTESNTFRITAQRVNRDNQIKVRTLGKGGFTIDLREADDNTQQYIDSVNAAAQTDADKLADAQNITHHYLGETRNFSRCDDDFAASTRFGLLADPWVVTPNIINQDNFTHGGFDNFENSQSISVEKWDGVLPAIEDGKIYQTTFAALPAGTYHLHFYVHANSGFSANECLLRVVSGDAFPGLATKNDVLATYDVRTGGYNGTVDACTFQLDEPTVVTIGFLFNIPEQNNGRAMRVNDLRIYDSANRDVTSKYLQNYTNIQRKDLSYRRFGQPTFWTVENFEIPNGTDGTKHGIDKYAGDNELMLGVWNDADNAKGSLRDAKLYQRVTLPAGDYFFGAAYEACYNIASGNLFVGTSALTAATTKTKALAYLPLNEAATDGKWYGKEFSLREPTELYLGWNIDLTTASTQEFRARELALLRLGDKRAEEAWQLGEELKANEVSRLLTAKNALNAEGKAVLTLERGCEVELGHALLDGVTAVKLWTNTLYSVAQDATLSLYLDDDFDPVATCQASDVQSTTPQRSVLYLPAITGIHRLTLQVCGTQCNLWKAVLSNEEDGIGSPSSAHPATNHGVFDLTGRRVTRPTRGLYIQDGRKIIR